VTVTPEALAMVVPLVFPGAVVVDPDDDDVVEMVVDPVVAVLAVDTTLAVPHPDNTVTRALQPQTVSGLHGRFVLAFIAPPSA
jgi:hypothetical protein